MHRSKYNRLLKILFSFTPLKIDKSKNKINQLEIDRGQVDRELGQDSDKSKKELDDLHESKEELESKIVSAVKDYLNKHDY